MGPKIVPPCPNTPQLPSHYRAAIAIHARAGELVRGDRADTHGDFAENLENIGRLWTAYLSMRGNEGPLSAADVAQMMVLLKIARTQSGEHNPDDYTDEIGYATIAAGLSCHKELPSDVRHTSAPAD